MPPLTLHSSDSPPIPSLSPSSLCRHTHTYMTLPLRHSPYTPTWISFWPSFLVLLKNCNSSNPHPSLFSVLTYRLDWWRHIRWLKSCIAIQDSSSDMIFLYWATLNIFFLISLRCPKPPIDGLNDAWCSIRLHGAPNESALPDWMI